MEQTPVEQIEGPLTVAQFKELLDKLSKQYDMLVALNRAVANGQSYPLPDGTVFSKQAAKSYNSAFKKAIKGLATDYSRALAKKKRRTTTNTRAPSYFTGEMVEFVRRADFGPAYTINEQGQCVEQGPLSDYLTLAKDNGIMVYNMIPALFSIYNNVHNLKRGPVIQADELMKRVFANTFRELAEKDIEEPKRARATKANPNQEVLEPFNPNAIPNPTGFSRMLSLNIIRKEDQTKEQEDYLKDTAVRDEAFREYDIVKSTLECIKRNNPTTPTKSKRKKQVRPA